MSGTPFGGCRRKARVLRPTIEQGKGPQYCARHSLSATETRSAWQTHGGRYRNCNVRIPSGNQTLITHDEFDAFDRFSLDEVFASAQSSHDRHSAIGR
jgi:hypothetical protein